MLPPDLIAKLDECARADFVGLRDAALFWQVAYSRMVIAGLLIEGPELIHEIASILNKWFPRIIERFSRFGWVVSSTRFIESAKIAAFIGWILIIWGLIGELRASSRIVDFSARIEECSDAKVRKATIEAGDAAGSAKIAHQEADAVKGIADEARADAKDALVKARAAQREMARAEADAAKAEAVSSNALSKATEAESHLAETMRGVKTLEADLDRLRTPRHLFHKTKIASPLKAFPRAEYMFIGSCGDQECFDLVSDINELLQFAGWKRIKGPPMRIGIPNFTIHGDKDFTVDESLSIGTGISVETPNGLDSIKALPENQLAEHIRAAIALNQVLASNISPPENTGKPVGIDTGTSTVVRIDVGRKPL